LQAWQDLEHSKFEQMINKLQAFPDFWKQFTYPTIAKFQYNMMAHVDDMTELKMENFIQSTVSLCTTMSAMLVKEYARREGCTISNLARIN